jgi:hypothetical protein
MKLSKADLKSLEIYRYTQYLAGHCLARPSYAAHSEGMNNRRARTRQGMSDERLRHFRDTIESSRSENKITSYSRTNVDFGVVVSNAEFVAPHALLSYARMITDFLSQITKKTKSMSIASAYVT